MFYLSTRPSTCGGNFPNIIRIAAYRLLNMAGTAHRRFLLDAKYRFVFQWQRGLTALAILLLGTVLLIFI